MTQEGTEEPDQYFKTCWGFLSCSCLPVLPENTREKHLGSCGTHPLVTETSFTFLCAGDLRFYQLQAKNLLLPQGGACRTVASTRENWPNRVDNCSDTCAFGEERGYGTCLPLSGVGLPRAVVFSSQTPLLSHLQASAVLKVIVSCVWGKIIHRECSRHTFSHRCSA